MRRALLHEQLLSLRERAGDPSAREIARRAAFSHASVTDLFNGRQAVPRWELVREVVVALGGYPEDFYENWRSLAMQRRSKLLKLRVPVETYAKLAAAAKVEKRPVHDVACDALVKGLDP